MVRGEEAIYPIMNLFTNTLINSIKAKFVTLPEEEIMCAQRKHWLVIVVPIVILSILGIAAWILLIIVSSYLTNYIIVLLPSAVLITLISLSIALRSFIDWYYNIYVITNRKILTISYSPLTSHKINEILLDQVKATEIDTKIDGILNELLNIGHVFVTFDRPTHGEELMFSYVKNPNKIETYLQNALYHAPAQNHNGNQQKRAMKLPSIVLYNKDKRHIGKWTRLFGTLGR